MIAQNCPELPEIKDEDRAADEQPQIEQRLTPIQMRAVELLAGGAKPGRVATTLNISRRTLFDWRRRNFDFMSEYHRLFTEVREHSVDRLRNLATLSIDRLETHVRSNHPPTARAAAVAIVRITHLGEAVSEPPPEPKPPASNDAGSSDEKKEVNS